MLHLHDPPRLRALLSSQGYAVVPLGEGVAEAARSPWTFAQQLLGERPIMLEKQPIRAVPGGRSFASSSAFTPLHSDSQLHLGAPPDVQIMACERAASRGGESLLLDTWRLLDELSREDPSLFDALFQTPRRIPFVFGDVFGPTVALRGASLAFTHSPISPPRDPIAARLASRVSARAAIALRVHPGEVMLVDNRRMLHGRNAFDDTARSFVRVLAWLSAPLATHPEHTERARRARFTPASTELAVRARFGASEAPARLAAERLRVVLSMLQGVPPGLLAHHEGVPEPVLYQWRDAAVSAAMSALDEAEGDDVAPRCEPHLGEATR